VTRTRSKLANSLPLVCLAAAALVSCYVFVAPGHPLTVDVWPHLSRTKMVYEALRDGHSPFWSFMFYSGYPALRFYSPLFYFVGGTFALATRGDVLLSLRILLVSLQILSACAMLLLLWRLTHDVQAAALGSLVYVYVPCRAALLGGWAYYPMAMTCLWLPLMLYFLDRLMDHLDRRDALLLGVVIGLNILSHVVYAAASVMLLCVVSLLGYPRPILQDKAHGGIPSPAPLASAILTMALAALGISAFFLVPFLAEYRSHAFPPSPTVVEGVSDLSGVLRALPGLLERSVGYLGVSVLALLLVAIAAVPFSVRRRYALGALLCLLATGLYVFVLPLLGSVVSSLTLNLPPERLLMVFLSFLALLVGSAWQTWKGRVVFFRRHSQFVFVALVGLVALDCTYGILVNYNPSKQRFLAARSSVYPLIAQHEHGKILDLTVLGDQVDDFMRTEAYPGIGYVFGGLPTPLGLFYQLAPRSVLYCHPWVNAVSADLGDTTTGVVAARTKTALALMGVSHVLMYPKVLQDASGPDSLSPRLLLKDGLRWDARFVVPGKRPYLVFGASEFGTALASTSTRPMRSESVIGLRTMPIADDWQVVLDSVSVDDTLGALSFIPVTARDRAESLPGSPALKVASTAIRNQDVTIRLTVSCECFLRLAVSYYAELMVTIDGRAVQFREAKDHFIWLRCPEGTHTIRVTAPLTPIRRWTLIVSALAAVMVIAGIVLPERRRA